MPELPEVETVRCVLEPQLRGLTIENVRAVRPEVIAHPDAVQFCRALKGQQIQKMDRRGKFLQIRLQSGDQIVLHLRMTGSLLLMPAESEREAHTHLIFQFAGGTELRFCDPRRFGRFWYVASGTEDTFSGVAKLGPEPFDPDFSAQYLEAQCGARKKTIKECLLDQQILAGIGNIYADEILFAAKLCPQARACSLSKQEWERLAAVIPERLHYFIQKNRISPQEYVEGKGKDYRNTPYLRIYGHAKNPCPVCGALLKKEKIGGRSSVFCPSCQPIRSE